MSKSYTNEMGQKAHIIIELLREEMFLYHYSRRVLSFEPFSLPYMLMFPN